MSLGANSVFPALYSAMMLDSLFSSVSYDELMPYEVGEGSSDLWVDGVSCLALVGILLSKLYGFPQLVQVSFNLVDSPLIVKAHGWSESLDIYIV